MKRAYFNPHHDDAYADDIDRIITACAAHDIDISREDARKAWEAYSETMAAGWMVMPDCDGSIFSTIRQYLTIDEDDDD